MPSGCSKNAGKSWWVRETASSFYDVNNVNLITKINM